jgi:predicted dinucleotide-binding enzyme
MEKASNTRAADLLEGYHVHRQERYRNVDEYRNKSRVGQLIARVIDPSIKEQIKIVEAFESVPAARLSAAQNEGKLVVF